MAEVCIHCETHRAGTPARRPGSFEDIFDNDLCGTCLLIPEAQRKDQKEKSVKLRAQAEKMIAQANQLIKGAKVLAGKKVDDAEDVLAPSAEDIRNRVDEIAGSTTAVRRPE